MLLHTPCSRYDRGLISALVCPVRYRPASHSSNQSATHQASRQNLNKQCLLNTWIMGSDLWWDPQDSSMRGFRSFWVPFWSGLKISLRFSSEILFRFAAITLWTPKCVSNNHRPSPMTIAATHSMSIGLNECLNECLNQWTHASDRLDKVLLRAPHRDSLRSSLIFACKCCSLNAH